MDAAAQAAAQAAANRRLNETISDLPKFYGTTKDTVSAETSQIASMLPSLRWHGLHQWPTTISKWLCTQTPKIGSKW